MSELSRDAGPGPAPRAVRTATSPCRRSPRARRRLATLAHATRSTSPTAASEHEERARGVAENRVLHAPRPTTKWADVVLVLGRPARLHDLELGIGVGQGLARAQGGHAEDAVAARPPWLLRSRPRGSQAWASPGKSKPCGMTPTTSVGTPFMRMVRPTRVESAPYRERPQVVAENRRRAGPSGTSSSGVNERPTSGRTPRRGRTSSLTKATETRSASWPSPVRARDPPGLERAHAAGRPAWLLDSRGARAPRARTWGCRSPRAAGTACTAWRARRARSKGSGRSSTPFTTLNTAGVGADGQRQGQDRHQPRRTAPGGAAEARSAGPAPSSSHHRPSSHPPVPPPPLVSHAGLHPLHVAQAARRLGPGLVLVHPLRHQLPHAHLQVEGDLLLHLAIDRRAHRVRSSTAQLGFSTAVTALAEAHPLGGLGLEAAPAPAR